MERSPGAGIESTADDLGAASFLAGAGVQRGVHEYPLGVGGVDVAAGCQSFGGEGGAVELVGEPCAFNDLGAGRYIGQDGLQDLAGATVPLPTGPPTS